MKISLLSFLLLSILSSLPQLVHSVSGGESSAATSYYCPNCGEIQVSDCLDCDGFLSTDTKHNICFDRRLFKKKNTDKEDPDDCYCFLLNDVLGAIVWFVTAGISMACVVGGGGIYLPLGILLLQFDPKPASVLSQARIFGASLGGSLLNGRHHHPLMPSLHEYLCPVRCFVF